MSGLELQEYLVTNGYNTPMIFITAFSEEWIRERAMGAEAVNFLSKPFEEPRLVDCVQRALKRHEGHSNDT